MKIMFGLLLITFICFMSMTYSYWITDNLNQILVNTYTTMEWNVLKNRQMFRECKREYKTLVEQCDVKK